MRRKSALAFWDWWVSAGRPQVTLKQGVIHVGSMLPDSGSRGPSMGDLPSPGPRCQGALA